jgi:peptidoglycan/LPS O-acetylase OafA/YrhL
MLVFPQTMGTQANAVRDSLCTLIGFPLVIALGVRASVSERLKRVCTYAGELSYPIYILNFPILRLACGAIKKSGLGEGVQYASVIPLVLCMTIVAAIALRFVDEPIRRGMSSIIRVRADQPSTSPT